MPFDSKKDKEREQRLILSENSPFLMKEDYKTLCTNIAFSFTDSEPKVIAITSSARSEGKSINSINLALSFSELGKKVVLVDCDLRLPTIAAKLGIPRKSAIPGLSNIIVGQSEFASSAKKYGNIVVLPAGTLPPDPIKLLSSERMKLIVSALKQSFDYVILDCPPVTEVIDAAVLSPIVDGYLMVVKHDASDMRQIDKMIDQLCRTNAKILGFIYVNAPTESKQHYKRYAQSQER